MAFLSKKLLLRRYLFLINGTGNIEFTVGQILDGLYSDIIVILGFLILCCSWVMNEKEWY